MEYLFPHRVAFQHVLFLHQIFVFLSVAVTRVVPVLFPTPLHADDPIRVKTIVGMLNNVAAQADREGEMIVDAWHRHYIYTLFLLVMQISNSLLQASEFADDDAQLVPSDTSEPRPPVEKRNDLLAKEMEAILIERAVQMEPPLQPLWEAAVRRRREAAAMARRPEVDLPEHDLPPTRLPQSQTVLSPRDGDASVEAPAGDDIEGRAPQLSSETLIVDEGPRQRTTSTKSYIRVIGRPVPELSNAQPTHFDDI